MQGKKKPEIKKKDVINAREASVSEFAANLNVIITSIHQKNKRDDDMQAIKDKIDVVRKENPVGLIEMAGPYLWKYKEKIGSENVSFFLNNSFEEDIEKAREESQLAEITEYEEIPALLNKVKRTWHSFTPPEQQIIVKRIKALLANYAKYLSASRTLKASESL